MYANRVELNEKNMLSIFRLREKRICLAPTNNNFVFAYIVQITHMSTVMVFIEIRTRFVHEIISIKSLPLIKKDMYRWSVVFI